MGNGKMTGKGSLMRCIGRFFIYPILFLVVLTLNSCWKDMFLDVNPDDLIGKWVVENTQEYWRFKSDGHGVTWDESEDIYESESNLKYEWTLEGDELTCVFRGDNENMAVPKVYRIREISSTSMKWEDYYGFTKNFRKL